MLLIAEAIMNFWQKGGINLAITKNLHTVGSQQEFLPGKKMYEIRDTKWQDIFTMSMAHLLKMNLTWFCGEASVGEILDRFLSGTPPSFILLLVLLRDGELELYYSLHQRRQHKQQKAAWKETKHPRVLKKHIEHFSRKRQKWLMKVLDLGSLCKTKTQVKTDTNKKQQTNRHAGVYL